MILKLSPPILFQGKPIFLTQEIGPILGYSDLAHSIKTSPTSMRERKELLLLEGDNLKQLKDLLRSGTGADRPQLSSQVLDTIKFSPKLIVLTKAGLQTLLLRSDKPAAIEYKDWVIYEVLPAIEKGQLPQQINIREKKEDEVSMRHLATKLLQCELKAAELLGVPIHYAQIEAVKVVEVICQIDYSPLLLKFPAQENIIAEEEYLEPTEIGKRLGSFSGTKINDALCLLGLQNKINGSWVPTEEGIKISLKHAWKRGSKSGYNYKWNIVKLEEMLKKELKK